VSTALALVVAACLAGLGAPLAQAETSAGAERATPPFGGEARLGNIELDRRARSFRVPGTVKRLDPPLEYLAVSRGGMKGYEALLELDAGGRDLNTACILIGLEPPADGTPRFQFDQEPIAGQPVGLRIGWEAASGPMEVDAGRGLTVQGQEAGEQAWVYIGSQFDPGGRYLAEDTGTLIGFVHDPISIIEHREGLGVGAYGSVAGNASLLPAPGTKVWLRVTNLGPAGAGQPARSE